MDHLLRKIAPISATGWSEIEFEASRTLRHFLAGRKLLDYEQAGGWLRSSRDLGRTTVVDRGGSVEVQNRLSTPITEFRAAFTVSRAELEASDRGATDMDTQPIIEAARAAALSEDQAVFAGNSAAGIVGIKAATPHETIQIENLEHFPHEVAKAINKLQAVGVGGPYGIGMGPECWTGVVESTESGGYPLLKHLKLLLDGPVVWAPSLEGAVVISQRGGDFQIDAGQDWSVGYASHTSETVDLYLQETFSFTINTPEAAVPLALAR
jgi:uncharacterized linocin/CFP29 family protein